jgi:trigger factor
MPIYEYDHITPWSTVERHEAENLTLLCPLHHAEKTKGLLPEVTVREQNSHPYNMDRSHSPAHSLHFRGDEFNVIMGSVRFTQRLSIDRRCDLIEVNEKPLISLRTQGSHLLISLFLRDRQGVEAVRIIDNELQYAVRAWDVEFSGKTLTVRKGKGEILARFSFNPPNVLSIAKGYFANAGVAIEVTRDAIECHPSGQKLIGGMYGGTYERGLVAWDKDHSPGENTSTFIFFSPEKAPRRK